MDTSGNLFVPDSPMQVSLNLKPYFCPFFFSFVSSSACQRFRQAGEAATIHVQTISKPTKQKY